MSKGLDGQGKVLLESTGPERATGFTGVKLSLLQPLFKPAVAVVVSTPRVGSGGVSGSE